jgi:murein tripeptide amidase MpaA
MEEDATYRWFCCFDTESILQPLSDSDPESSSGKMAEHILVSVVLSFNIPGFQEAVCFIELQPAGVVEKMMQHLECLQQEASHLMREYSCLRPSVCWIS